MKAFEELKEKLCKEIEELSKKQSLSIADLDILHKATDTVKNIEKIMMLKGGGYSEDDGASYGMSRGMSRNSYESGNSYARRGEHYVRGHYSRDEGYSQGRGKSEMLEKLDDMMRESRNEKEREAIQKCIQQIDRLT